jgi:hypothetical protein
MQIPNIFESKTVSIFGCMFPFGVEFACFHKIVSDTKKNIGMVFSQVQDTPASGTTYNYSVGSELFGVLSTQISETY